MSPDVANLLKYLQNKDMTVLHQKSPERMIKMMLTRLLFDQGIDIGYIATLIGCYHSTVSDYLAWHEQQILKSPVYVFYWTLANPTLTQYAVELADLVRQGKVEKKGSPRTEWREAVKNGTVKKKHGRNTSKNTTV